MANQQLYQAADADWASSAELVVNEPVKNHHTNLRLTPETSNPVQFVIFAASTPNGQVPSDLDTKLKILDSNLVLIPSSSQSPDSFLSNDERVAILVNPAGNSWTASIQQGQLPFGVTGIAFHPPTSAPPGPSATPPRFRCRVCKSTAKALALAIVAAAGMAALPAALITSVSLFLGGVGAVAATTFINNVLGDTAAVVAEKLCTAVGLCP
jgi:hypothetical protein